MQITPISEVSFLQSRMTMDAVRMECLVYQQLVEQHKGIIHTQAKKIEELEKQLAQKEAFLKKVSPLIQKVVEEESESETGES